MAMKPRLTVMVIADSMTNSVFQGQVLEPLYVQRKQNPCAPYIILSLESVIMPRECYAKLVPLSYHISWEVIKRGPFWGTLSLYPTVRRLRKALSHYDSYNIIARGAIAGFLSARALNPRHCRSLLIQARGLLAEEYRYTHMRNQTTWSYLHALRARSYEKIERMVYGSHFASSIRNLISFESVSDGLAEYLTQQYQTDPARILVTCHDFPRKIESSQRLKLRKQMRVSLDIAYDAYVYCYNGSAHPWQCPEEIVRFFSGQLSTDPRAILLIVTQEAQAFEMICKKYEVPGSNYRIISVDHTNVYSYLCVADAGILFRESHIINWVSRPTKLLEYCAAQLQIIHNGTVAYVCSLKSTDQQADCKKHPIFKGVQTHAVQLQK